MQFASYCQETNENAFSFLNFKDIVTLFLKKKKKDTTNYTAGETVKHNCFQVVADGSKITQPLPSQRRVFYLGNQSCHLFLNCLLQILLLENLV